jgi:putative transposase
MVSMMTGTAHAEDMNAPPLPAGYSHGTTRAYRFCRPSCTECRAANAAAKGERRAIRIAAGMPDEAHGKPSGYSYWNCRCDLCVVVYLGEPKAKAPTRADHRAASVAALGDADTRTVRYEYEILPDVVAARQLRRVMGCVRYIYNSAVSFAVQHRKETGKFPPAAGQSARIITAPRKELPWLAEAPFAALSAALRDAQQAQANYLSSLSGKRKGRKMGPPRTKRRAHGGTMSLSDRNFRIKGGWQNTGSTGGRLYLGKHIGWVGVRWSRRLPSEPSSLTVRLTPAGRFFVSFVVLEPLRRTMPQNPGRVAGVDLGITHFATVAHSDGSVRKIPNPRFLLKQERKLAHMQRDLARMEGPRRGQKPSNRWEKQRRRVARLHAHIANQRESFARREAARLIRENQGIVVESLNIAGLARTKVGKALYDSAWGIFLNALKEGAAKRGRDLIVLPRFFPGSRTCSACGVVDGAKPLSVRIWNCPSCGVAHDRDINAAFNHLEYAHELASSASRLEELDLAAGLAERVNARGWGVGPTVLLARDTTPCEARIGRTQWERKLLAGRRRSRRSALRRKHVRNGAARSVTSQSAQGLAEDAGGIAGGSWRIHPLKASEYPRNSAAH